MEVFTDASQAEVIDIPRTAQEIPNHMRRDPTTGLELSEEDVERLAASLPPAKQRRGNPYETFQFPVGAPDRVNSNLVPRVSGEDPLDTLYNAFMEQNPTAKRV